MQLFQLFCSAPVYSWAGNDGNSYPWVKGIILFFACLFNLCVGDVMVSNWEREISKLNLILDLRKSLYTAEYLDISEPLAWCHSYQSLDLMKLFWNNFRLIFGFCSILWGSTRLPLPQPILCFLTAIPSFK